MPKVVLQFLSTMDDDDLTASHWDDVLLPSTRFGAPATIPAHLGNQFADLSLEDPHKATEDEEEEDLEEDDSKRHDTNINETTAYDSIAEGGFGTGHIHHHQAELDQLHELRKEERNEQKSALMSELTLGSALEDLETSMAKAPDINHSGLLFGDTDKMLTQSDALESSRIDHVTSPKKALQLKQSQFKATRPRRYPQETVVKQLKAEAGEVDPLSVLANTSDGEDAENPTKRSKKADDFVRESNAPLYDIEHNTGREETQASETTDEHSKDSSNHKKRKASLSTEISVGNPVKVGDITNAHIVYSIESRNLQLNPSEIAQNNRFTVTRRYRDFCWVYKQLQLSHPGRIVPPPPAKKTYIGRFNENFIENRRLSLEKMLEKMSKNQYFATDPSFIIFLTSEDFTRDSKERERTGGVVLDDSGEVENDGTLATSVVTGTSSGGFMSSLFSIPTKLPEPDLYFSKKKAYIDDLEYNLRTFQRSLDDIAHQRVESVSMTEEIAVVIDELADLEILKTTTLLLKAFSDVHMKLKENLDRINQQDQLTLGFTVEEHLRIIGSVKHIFETRTKTYNQFHSFQQDLIKKEESLNKLTHKYKSSTEKINMLQFEVDKLKQKTEQFEKSFNSISEIIKEEMENFELERISDFRNSVEIYVESMIESQKEAIELWETLYERQQLDKI